jgi:hypothetical protein
MSLPTLKNVPISQLVQSHNGFEYKELPTEVEVLTLNLNAGSMRVRYINNEGKKKVVDTSIDHFFKKYEIKVLPVKERFALNI